MKTLAFPPIALLAACASVPPPGEPVVVGAGSCHAETLERFAGQPATSDVASQMLQASGARTLRWTGPGMAVTMDYREDRITVTLDDSYRTIVRANCG